MQELETKLESEATTVVNTKSVLGTGTATNLGTFSGSTIADNSTVKTAVQELETKLEEMSLSVSTMYESVKDACIDMMYRDPSTGSWYSGSGFIIRTPATTNNETSWEHSQANLHGTDTTWGGNDM